MGSDSYNGAICELLGYDSAKHRYRDRVGLTDPFSLISITRVTTIERPVFRKIRRTLFN